MVRTIFQSAISGRIQYQLKNPFRNGTTHILFSPLDFLSKLAALVPRPRHNLVRYHGVLAPNSKMRTLIVPKNNQRLFKKVKDKEDAKRHKTAEQAASRHELVAPLTWAQRLKRVFERAALGLILPCAPCVAVPCGLSLTSLIQTSSKRFSITSKHNHHRLSLRLPFNPKTSLDLQVKISLPDLKLASVINPTACKPADQHHYSH